MIAAPIPLGEPEYWLEPVRNGSGVPVFFSLGANSDTYDGYPWQRFIIAIDAHAQVYRVRWPSMMHRASGARGIAEYDDVANRARRGGELLGHYLTAAGATGAVLVGESMGALLVATAALYCADSCDAIRELHTLGASFFNEEIWEQLGNAPIDGWWNYYSSSDSALQSLRLEGRGDVVGLNGLESRAPKIHNVDVTASVGSDHTAYSKFVTPSRPPAASIG